MYSICCCSCSFEPEIIKIGQSYHKMYSNNILNFQESMTILNACTKKFWKLIEGATYIFIIKCCGSSIRYKHRTIKLGARKGTSLWMFGIMAYETL